MKDKKDARDKFIELTNKKFTDEDVFIRLSYKKKEIKPIDTIKDILRFLKMPFRDKKESMKNKNINFEDCFDSFYIELLQFKRRCKRDFGLKMEFDINFKDEDGNFVRGCRTDSKKGTLKAPKVIKFSIDNDITDESIENLISILNFKLGQS